ncbi:MAG: PDZ domain-containing protein [Gemmatimonadota bacterium]
MNKRLIAVVLAVLTLGGIVAAAGSVSAQEKTDGKDRAHHRAPPFVMSGSGGSFLGVYIDEVDRDAVDRLHLPAERGVLVDEVAEDSPAADAGLEEDDVIMAWNGETIEGTASLRRHLAETPAGRTVSLRVFRDGRARDVSVKLGEGEGARGLFSFAPTVETGRIRDRLRELGPRLQRSLRVLARPGENGFMTYMAFGGRGRMGVAIQTLGDQLGAYFGLGDRSGVLVTSVADGSAAEDAGLKAGDVILSIGGDEIEDPGDVMRIVGKADEGPIEVKILRDRRERTLTVDLPESKGLRWSDEDGEEHGLFYAPDVEFGPNEFHFGPVEAPGLDLDMDFDFEPAFDFRFGPVMERLEDRLIRANPNAAPTVPRRVSRSEDVSLT